MSENPMWSSSQDLCQHCFECYGRRAPAAFLIKHPETSKHWRCLKCVRDLVSDGKPFLIYGMQTETRRSVIE